MMLLAIALSTASLSAQDNATNINVAALQCAAVSIEATNEDPTLQFRALSQFMHLSALAATADPGSDTFLNRITEKSKEALRNVGAANNPTRSSCEVRFSHVYNARIPAAEGDSFLQDTICLLGLSLLHGLASQSPGFSGGASISEAMNLYGTKVSDETLAERGLGDTEKFLKFGSDLLSKRLQTHSFEGIALGCGVSPY